MLLALSDALFGIVVAYFPELATVVSREGDKQFFEWLWRLRLVHDMPAALAAACASGHFELSDTIWGEGVHVGKRWRMEDVLEEVCMRGTTASLLWLQLHNCYDTELINSGRALNLASEFGNEQLAMQLWDSTLYERQINTAFVKASKGGCLKLVTHILQLRGYKLNTSGTEAALEQSCIGGHLPIVVKLISDCNPYSKEVGAEHSKLFIKTCGHGKLDVATWLLDWIKEQKPALSLQNYMVDAAFRVACEGGHLSTAIWLYGIHPQTQKTFKSSAWKRPAMLKACKQGHLDVMVWLWGTGMTLEDLRIENTAVMRFAFDASRLDIAQWLWGLGLTLCDIQGYEHEILGGICSRGDAEMAEWVTSIGINIRRLLCYQAGIACASGSIPLLRLLVRNGFTKEILRDVIIKIDVPQHVRLYINSKDAEKR